MSIKFDPHQPINNNSGIPPERKRSLFEKWIDSVLEGQRIERTPCNKYCEEKWTENTLTSMTDKSRFLEKCQNNCELSKSIGEGLDKL